MSEYKALDQMGVQNPEQIDRFAFYTVDKTDILHIVYNRKRGSVLPVRRKYKFPQVKKSTLVDSGTRQTQVLYESAPVFRNAITELNRIMKKKESKEDMQKIIADEVRSLEEDVALRIDYIKSLVKKL